MNYSRFRVIVVETIKKDNRCQMKQGFNHLKYNTNQYTQLLYLVREASADPPLCTKLTTELHPVRFEETTF